MASQHQHIETEVQLIKDNNPDLSNRQVFETLMNGVFENFHFELRRIGDLHWDERIDDKVFERLKSEARQERDEDTQDVYAWYDWVKDGRPE